MSWFYLLDMTNDGVAVVSCAVVTVCLAILVLRRGNDFRVPPWLVLVLSGPVMIAGMKRLVDFIDDLDGVIQWNAIYAVFDTLTVVSEVTAAVSIFYMMPRIMRVIPVNKHIDELNAAVQRTSMEKNTLIHVINHRIGNQLQVIASFVNIELRKEQRADTIMMLRRLQYEVDRMGQEHVEASAKDYLHEKMDIAPSGEAAKVFAIPYEFEAPVHAFPCGICPGREARYAQGEISVNRKTSLSVSPAG